MEDTTKAFVKAMQKFTSNASNAEMQEAAQAIIRMHLTHQNRLGQFLHYLVESMNNYPYEDLRNEGVKTWCRDIMRSVPPGFFPFI